MCARYTVSVAPAPARGAGLPADGRPGAWGESPGTATPRAEPPLKRAEGPAETVRAVAGAAYTRPGTSAPPCAGVLAAARVGWAAGTGLAGARTGLADGGSGLADAGPGPAGRLAGAADPGTVAGWALPPGAGASPAAAGLARRAAPRLDVAALCARPAAGLPGEEGEWRGPGRPGDT